jgi:4-phytase/acid phosphatase
MAGLVPAIRVSKLSAALRSEMAMRRWRLCVGLLLAALMHDAAAAALVLEKVVLISRHGVRSPIGAASSLDEMASRPWPAWPVPPGHLTPRGKDLATRMGEFYRQRLAVQRLLPTRGCPGPNDVYVWADVDQRTRLTAEGLLAGLAPDCGITVHHAPTDKPDPVFHPVRAGVCTVDADRGRAAVLERAGGSLDNALKPYRGSLRKLQGITGCCAPKLCPAASAGRCTLLTMPSSIEPREKDGSMQISGPISIGSTTSEIFLLEYAQGMPPHQVAWGLATPPGGLNSLLRLHRLDFDLIERTPYLAGRQGSAIVQRILEALRPTGERAPGPQSQVPAESKLVIFVGHDTNLANIGGLLGLHWRLRTYVPDETPPAGALAFELLRDTATGRHFVRMSYFAQTLDQMRRMARLSLANPPAQAKVVLPGCSDGPQGACPWQEFDARVQKALDRDCVVTKAQ